MILPSFYLARELNSCPHSHTDQSLVMRTLHVLRELAAQRGTEHTPATESLVFVIMREQIRCLISLEIQEGLGEKVEL